MGTRKGRRIAVVSAAAVVGLCGLLVWLGRKHIRFALAFESLGPNAQGYDEYRHRQTGIVFVSLPGGTFLMGTSDKERFRLMTVHLVGEEQIASERPQHEVRLSPFLISKHEVTQTQWASVMRGNPSDFMDDDLPVANVSWQDCQEFCVSTGLALPTEAQWEYACRGGTTGLFAGVSNVGELGWYIANSRDGPRAVGRKRPNDFGLHDMHGNVWEWCEDSCQLDFYAESAGATDPLCVNAAYTNRVLRGGCWYSTAVFCRSAYRSGLSPSRGRRDVGFRVAYPPH